MKWIALIDTTAHTAAAPPGRIVAGLTLLERAVRLAAVSDCTHAVIATDARFAEEVEALAADIDFGIELVVHHGEARAVGDVLVDAAPTVEPLLAAADGVLYLRSSTVYDRGLLHLESPAQSPLHAPIKMGGTACDTFDCERAKWPELVERCQRERPQDLDELLAAGDAALVETDKWQVRVHDTGSAKRAEDRLWNSCRKAVDGIVSRHLNRHISLAISRRIAATGISPNHISIVTFSLGVLAAVFAGMGGYLWFALAGLTYQLNSVIDGVDGELARVKYEFSVLGEWLDTISDDTKDVLFYGGLAVGAFHTWGFPLEAFGPQAWLTLGGIAVTGKLISMVAYYTWLIAHGRGDLLAFEWSFEDDTDEPSGLAALLSSLKYVTKNDFIVFVAMCMAIAGVLPYFLFIVAPGQFVVATSVIIQRIKRA